MSKGANSQAGFNAQNWAALSLFIQYSKSTVFQRIELEQHNLADFVLVFNDKRIICESKKSHVTYADIREIFDTIPTIEESDEILIICTSTGPRVKEDLDNSRYFIPVKKELMEKHKFKSRHIKLLPRLKIWVVDQDMNETIIRNLMVERFQSWLPDDELNDLISSVLIHNIYNKSAESSSYSRLEFVAELNERKQRLKEKDDYKINERSAKDIIRKLLAELHDPESRVQSENRLKGIIADSKLHFFAIREITKADDLNLKAWHNFWAATFSSFYSREVLRIFKDNINTLSDAKYVVGFLNDHMARLRFKNLEEYELKSCADVLMKALDKDRDTIKQVYALLKRLYQYSTENPLSFDDKTEPRDKWLMEELASDFSKIYAAADIPLKNEVIDFIYSNFNLVDEEYEYWHRTPHTFFQIIKTDLLRNPTKFNDFLVQIEAQYFDYYKRYGIKYDGWELMGGGVSNMGGNYTVQDKALLTMIVTPYLNSLTTSEKWLICDEYIADKVSVVSNKKPDFMNRALIPFLITEYTDGNERAFKILSNFVRMRKGIPHKAELTYFGVRNSTEMSSDQKWRLLEVALKEFGFPINVFMDQILWQLLQKSYPKALNTFTKLLDNKDYMGRQSIFDNTVIEALSKIIDNPETLNQGVKLLKKYLRSRYFRTLSSFDSYDAKTPVLSVLNKDVDMGIDLIKSLIKTKPNDNRQRVFGAVLRDAPEDCLLLFYEKIVLPELKAAGNSQTLALKLTNTETRENFIWFAEKLSKKHDFDRALWIVDFFLDDPSPAQGNEYDKDILAGKHDFTINTVRGCIAWVLLPVNSVAGRDYTERAFEITKKLCTDKSLYVRQMSLMLLESLTNNRHTTMPDSKEWFMDYSIAESIEEFAFEMLADETNYHKAVMQHLARVFMRIRTLGNNQAVMVIETFLKHGDIESLKNLDSFILFMAEFRKESFKDWPKSRGIIPKYDDEPVRKILEDLLVNGLDEQRQSLVWNIVKLPEEATKDNDLFARFFAISKKYLSIAIENYSHHVYSDVYRFIDKYIDREFEDCYKIWRRCIEIEKPAIVLETKKDQHIGEYNWWPHHYNGSILIKVLANKGPVNFLDDLEFLADYPEEVSVPFDIDNALTELEALSENRSQIKRIYEKLIARSYLFNNSYEKWISNSKGNN